MTDPAETVRAALVDSLARLLDPDVLIEALVRRGVLVEEEAIEQTRTDGTRGHVIEHLDGRRTSHEDAWLPRTVPVSRYVTDWQEADDE